MSVPGKEAFCRRFGAVFEHSAWIAEAVFDQAVQDGLKISKLGADGLAARFESVFLKAGRDRQLAILRAHPALACSLAEPRLTANSQAEQHAAGLDQCTESELKLFREYNDKYMNKFVFPFIIAVKGCNRAEILQCFEKRLSNDLKTEFQMALLEVCQIARFRIEASLND